MTRKRRVQLDLLGNLSIPQKFEDGMCQRRIGQDRGETVWMEMANIGVTTFDADKRLRSGLFQQTTHRPHVRRPEQGQQWTRGANLSRLFDAVSHARFTLSIHIARRRSVTLLDQKLEVFLRPEVPECVGIGHRIPSTLLVRNIGIHEEH